MYVCVFMMSQLQQLGVVWQAQISLSSIHCVQLKDGTAYAKV